MKTADFFYDLPETAIAQTPIEPRDAARLLDTRDMTDRRFEELPHMLEAGDLLVVNRTRVRAARLLGTKSETGGAVETLLLSQTGDGGWDALIKPARRVRAGLRIEFARGLNAVVRQAPVDGRCIIEFPGRDDHELPDLIEAIGQVPLPPYIREPLADASRYQTVYANEVGSAAAPTAGLHFTENVLKSLAERGVERAHVDLEVGLDTFRPISVEEVEDHRMHSEKVLVPEETCAAISATRRRGGRIVAVGTTVVRSLESAADEDGIVHPFDAATALFINPGYRFRAVDGLITNFHVPGSTLVVLVAAILGNRWRAAYEEALERGYRFLSFGDAMYAEVKRL
ncbi:MAG TPA: tRNA preQ1(34) S-adenosylmethionine ribosyltransferase-isomerase QueA [Acidimicrobiia bacterium]|nr:tRNA preQ1(34) S-adenosylmethionine ribosyltransferase-isomerase QueA [Acidimicrobiia bacterium]